MLSNALSIYEENKTDKIWDISKASIYYRIALAYYKFSEQKEAITNFKIALKLDEDYCEDFSKMAEESII
ncbi:MAG: tetratricopeptide repeat protein [Candidatus Cloacimonetes bacterium]|nr:tetratricopeptide repeat protein [Candidatus Cloacimonadota bacterium]